MRLDADDAFIAATTNKRVKTNSRIRFLRYRGQLNLHITTPLLQTLVAYALRA